MSPINNIKAGVWIIGTMVIFWLCMSNDKPPITFAAMSLSFAIATEFIINAAFQLIDKGGDGGTP